MRVIWAKAAGQLIREANFDKIDYYGFVEGDDIGRGTVDVVVTEGFAGNIALKAAEGTARQIAEYLRAAMSRTWLARLGYILAKGAFDRVREFLMLGTLEVTAQSPSETRIFVRLRILRIFSASSSLLTAPSTRTTCTFSGNSFVSTKGL